MIMFPFLYIYCMLYILICSAGTYSRYVKIFVCVNICVFILVAILNPRVEDMLYLLDNFLVIVAIFALLSLHTYTFTYHEWGPIPEFVKFRNRGVVYQNWADVRPNPGV